MNTQNYASLEACQRLVDAGIVLETEAVWRKKRDKTGYYLSRKALYHRNSDVPAPSFVELWRELPETMEDYELNLQKAGGGKLTSAAYCRADHAIYKCTQKGYYATTNPADALAELLIWVRGEKI